MVSYACSVRALLSRILTLLILVYDATRGGLLRGRHTMLRLAAAQLREQRRADPNKRLIWVDVGGGTGDFPL
jgi:hypothetical protein